MYTRHTTTKGQEVEETGEEEEEEGKGKEEEIREEGGKEGN